MSLKSIELQLSMPKTQELGKLQNQLHQRTNIEQNLLMIESKKIEIEKRKKAEKIKKSQFEELNTMRKPKSPIKDEARGNFVDIEL